jgi:hypothetical protein
MKIETIGIVLVIMLVFALIACDNDNTLKPCPCGGVEHYADEMCNHDPNVYDCKCTSIERPKNQSATLENLFGEGYSATVKGNLNDAQWTGVADKIETALNAAFNSGTGPAGAMLKTQFRNVFTGNNVEIIVEVNPSGYTKWKTDATGKKMWLAFDKLDSDLQGSVDAAVEKMSWPEAGYAMLKLNNARNTIYMTKRPTDTNAIASSVGNA